jgi:putative ABC transport system ATP-binding protein
MSDFVCEVMGIGKSYGGPMVVHDVELTVARGEMVAITGKSGSGKSTLLNIIGLLETADRGQVRLFGAPSPKVGSGKATWLLRHKMGYLFQNFALIDGESVDYNLRVAQAYVGGSGSIRRAAREVALAAVELSGFSKRKVYELSGGEQQRVAIARLMLKPCEFILADEPTGSLDSVNRDIVLTLLRQLNAGGKTVVLVTHDERVAGTCHRAVSLPDPR